MSHIYKSGKNYVIEFSWRGKRYCRSLRVSDKKGALLLQKKIDYDIVMGIFDPEAMKNQQKRRELHLKDFINNYIIFVESNTKKYSPKTIDDYKYSANLLLRILDNRNLKEIDTLVFETEINPLLNDTYSYNSIRHHLMNFRSMFNKAIEWELIEKNPFSKKVPKKRKKIPRYFLDKEIQIMKEYYANRPKWQEQLVFFTMNTGLRKSEVLNLRWDKNIDLLNGWIFFPGKGNKDRYVPLNDTSLNILRKRRRHINNHSVFWEIKNRTAVIQCGEQ